VADLGGTAGEGGGAGGGGVPAVEPNAAPVHPVAPVVSPDAVDQSASPLRAVSPAGRCVKRRLAAIATPAASGGNSDPAPEQRRHKTQPVGTDAALAAPATPATLPSGAATTAGASSSARRRSRSRRHGPASSEATSADVGCRRAPRSALAVSGTPTSAAATRASSSAPDAGGRMGRVGSRPPPPPASSGEEQQSLPPLPLRLPPTMAPAGPGPTTASAFAHSAAPWVPVDPFAAAPLPPYGNRCRIKPGYSRIWALPVNMPRDASSGFPSTYELSIGHG